MLKELYEVYYNNSGGDLSAIPSNVDTLLAAAINDELVPDNFTKDNGFGGEIDLTVSGALIRIGTTLPADKIYAKKIYSTILGTTGVKHETDGAKSTHVFSMVGTVLDHIVMTNNFSRKATDANATTITSGERETIKTGVTAGDIDGATLTGQEWWEYDVKIHFWSLLDYK